MIHRHTIYTIPWIDLENPTGEDIQTIIEEFNLDELWALELTRPSLRAKVDRHNDQLFMVLHFPDHPAQNTTGTIEIDFVIHRDFIITARYTHIDTLMVFEKQHNLADMQKAEIHGGTIFSMMLTDFYHGLVEELSLIKKDIADVETEIFANADKNISKKLLTLHRKRLDCRSALRFHTDILSSFEHESLELFGASYERPLQSITSMYYRMTTILENNRETTYELRETYDAMLTHTTNEVMKTLTLMSFITFPLSLVAIILFDPASPHIFHGEYGSVIILGILFIIFLMMMLFFKKRKWI